MANRNTDINDPVHIHGLIKAAMWKHSQINPNGFLSAISRDDRRKQRAELQATIDRLLDEYKTSMMLLDLEHTPCLDE